MSAHGRFTESAANQRPVKEVQFGILSPDEIRSMSVLKVEFSDIRDESGKVLAGGLSDPRLGTTDRAFKCQTCGESMSDCPDILVISNWHDLCIISVSSKKSKRFLNQSVFTAESSKRMSKPIHFLQALSIQLRLKPLTRVYVVSTAHGKFARRSSFAKLIQ
ncbi:hypothetical protein L7F22_053999 [Adiantum nelumboides]|nr:hypothetical protein [Adiantum nelumboides]